jgi:exopolyphosphatase/guanosine-5'-triphosphate,3'-diphosphate pyrophosphatase
VVVGGLVIMLALFQELGITTMTAAQGAMREGILWDLLGRVHDHDMRDVTVNQFQRRYRVDTRQARRVEHLALSLFPAVARHLAEDPGDALHRLMWAARMHEIGISIAHAGLHRHGAYIIENADMPGFSRRDQIRLAALVRASRGGLNKLTLGHDDANWPLILCLRLAVLFNASRSDVPPPALRLDCVDGDCRLSLPAAWLKANPLSQAVLDEELQDWTRVAPRVRLAGITAE